MNKFTKTYDSTIENCLFTILILNDIVLKIIFVIYKSFSNFDSIGYRWGTIQKNMSFFVEYKHQHLVSSRSPLLY